MDCVSMRSVEVRSLYPFFSSLSDSREMDYFCFS